MVDFAIAPSNKDSSKPTILLETKSYKTDLSKDWHRHPHNGEKEYPKEQLACYYDNTPDAELGILTNGFEYWFLEMTVLLQLAVSIEWKLSHS